jgi:hypothetical protein
MCIKINKIGKQEVGIWWVQKRFPRYGVPIWSLWPNIRFLPSILAEKNATKNAHICSMCIKINIVGKQEVGIQWVQKCFPRYGVPIWSLWPNIRFLPSIVADKNGRSWHAEHVCCLNLTSISYSFWNKGQKVLTFWKFDEKRVITPKWILRFT